jgi:hypothetical protein
MVVTRCAPLVLMWRPASPGIAALAITTRGG